MTPSEMIVSNSHIRITSVSIQTRSEVYTSAPAYYGYALDSDIPVVGASHVDASSVVVEIPDTIDDIPVTEIGDMTVSIPLGRRVMDTAGERLVC